MDYITSTLVYKVLLNGHFTKDCFFQSARSGPDCPDDFLFYRPDCRPVVVLVEDLVRVGCLQSVDTTHNPR